MTQEFRETSHKRAEDTVLCRMYQALVAEQQDTIQSSAHGRAADICSGDVPPRVAANQNFRCEECNLGVGTLARYRKHLEGRRHQLRVGPRWFCLLCGIPDLFDASTHAQHVAGNRHMQNVQAAGGAVGQPVVGETLRGGGNTVAIPASPSSTAAPTELTAIGVGQDAPVGGSADSSKTSSAVETPPVQGVAGAAASGDSTVNRTISSSSTAAGTAPKGKHGGGVGKSGGTAALGNTQSSTAANRRTNRTFLKKYR